MLCSYTLSYLHKGIQCFIERAHSPVELSVLSRELPVFNTRLISRGREGEREERREGEERRGKEEGKEGGGGKERREGEEREGGGEGGGRWGGREGEWE